jgi:hypothetical protein
VVVKTQESVDQRQLEASCRLQQWASAGAVQLLARKVGERSSRPSTSTEQQRDGWRCSFCGSDGLLWSMGYNLRS